MEPVCPLVVEMSIFFAVRLEPITLAVLARRVSIVVEPTPTATMPPLPEPLVMLRSLFSVEPIEILFSPASILELFVTFAKTPFFSELL